MRKLTRTLAILIAAIMAMTAMCVSVGAFTPSDNRERYPSSTSITGTLTSGSSYSALLKSNDSEVIYKLTTGSAGTLKVVFTAEMSTFHPYLYDSAKNLVDYGSVNVTAGTNYISEWHSIDWDSREGFSSGSVSFKVSKGTYYLRFIRDYNKGGGTLKFKVTFPENTSNVSAASESMLQIYLEEGESLKIGALIGGKKASSAKYSTSDSKIAKVSTKGKVKALSAGTAVITVKSGSETLKFQLVVEEDD